MSTIRLIDLKQEKAEFVKVMVCQIDKDKLQLQKDGRLNYVVPNKYLDCFVSEMLRTAQINQVQVVVFPELTIPTCYREMMMKYAISNQMLIIAGTHYKDIDGKTISVCPIIMPKTIYETEKVNPSPYELGAIGKQLSSGETVYKFKNTEFGSFAVIICADYMHDDLKHDINLNDLDILYVIACNKRNADYFNRMSVDVKDSDNGLYILYSNVISERDNLNGESAVFGEMLRDFSDALIEEGCTDLQPEQKLFTLDKRNRYFIATLDLKTKRPYVMKNKNTRPNVHIDLVDSEDVAKQNQFLITLGVSDEHISNINQFYVKPNEYNDILHSLENNGIVMIVGDPGIGKTFTAFYLLRHYFDKGNKVKYVAGLSKEDRASQDSQLQSYMPDEGEVIYLEDPFGRTQFENLDALYQYLMPLVSHAKTNGAKLIITSRSEVYQTFTKKFPSHQELDRFKQEMNVQRPSYSTDALHAILAKYVEYSPHWSSNDKNIKLITNAINKRDIQTPLMLSHIINSYSGKIPLKDFKHIIELHQQSDLVEPIAEEIKHLDLSTQILLFVIYIQINAPFELLSELYHRGAEKIARTNKFICQRITTVLREQQVYRVKRIGAKDAYYRFAHPVFEEACAKLIASGGDWQGLFQALFSTYLQLDEKNAIKFLNKNIQHHPNIVRIVIDEIISNEDVLKDGRSRLQVCANLSYAPNNYFAEDIKQLLPIEDLVNMIYDVNMYSETYNIMMNLLYKRKEEIIKGINRINWDFIFKKEIISRMTGSGIFSLARMYSEINIKLRDVILSRLTPFELRLKIYTLPFEDIPRIVARYKDSKWEKILTDEYDVIANNPELIGKSSKRRYLLQRFYNGNDIEIDLGAFKALRRGARLYPAGVVSVTGEFNTGEVVKIFCKSRKDFFLAVPFVTSEFLRCFKGKRTEEICYLTNNRLINTTVSKSGQRVRVNNKL